MYLEFQFIIASPSSPSETFPHFSPPFLLSPNRPFSCLAYIEWLGISNAVVHCPRSANMPTKLCFLGGGGAFRFDSSAGYIWGGFFVARFCDKIGIFWVGFGK